MENKVKWNVLTKVEKYNTDESFRNREVDEVFLSDGNMLLDCGVTDLWNLVCGVNSNLPAANNAYDATHTYIGVGDGTVVESKAHTNLQGNNQCYKKIDVAPAISGNKVTFKATFYGLNAPAGQNFVQAAFTWSEWTVCRGDVSSPPIDGATNGKTGVVESDGSITGDAATVIGTTTKNPTQIKMLLNRKKEEMGSKHKQATWVITVEISLS